MQTLANTAWVTGQTDKLSCLQPQYGAIQFPCICLNPQHMQLTVVCASAAGHPAHRGACQQGGVRWPADSAEAAGHQRRCRSRRHSQPICCSQLCHHRCAILFNLDCFMARQTWYQWLKPLSNCFSGLSPALCTCRCAQRVLSTVLNYPNRIDPDKHLRSGRIQSSTMLLKRPGGGPLRRSWG